MDTSIEKVPTQRLYMSLATGMSMVRRCVRACFSMLSGKDAVFEIRTMLLCKRNRCIAEGEPTDAIDQQLRMLERWRSFDR